MVESQKLVAIYNCWADSVELLPFGLKNIMPMVDHTIIVWSDASNYGEIQKNYLYEHVPITDNITLVKWEPDLNRHASENERTKRNFGLRKAKEMGFTHFITMDCDEFYKPDEFESAKRQVYDQNLNGMVANVEVYFGAPNLSAGIDTTLVPFIHKLTPSLDYVFNRRYPYAFINNEIRIDPTRQLNIEFGVTWNKELTMHHYSWVRNDYMKKIRNSSARENIMKSDVLNELVLAKDGYYCKFYRKTLSRAKVDFGICF